MFSVEQTQRKCVAYGDRRGPCFSVTKASDKAAFPLSFPPQKTSIMWQPTFGKHPGDYTRIHPAGFMALKL